MPPPRLKPLPKAVEVFDPVVFNRDGVDPTTGLLKLRKPPGSKLDEHGKNRIVELIAVYGLSNADVAERLVRDGFVKTFTAAAVSWWRKTPEVALALTRRDSDVFQRGLASRHVRVGTLVNVTDAIIRANFRRGDDGETLTLMEEEDPRAKTAQAAMIGQIRDNFKMIADLVGDNDPSLVRADPTKEGLRRFGMAEKTPEEVRAMLSAAMNAVETGMAVNALVSLNEQNSKDNAIDGEIVSEDFQES